MLFNSLTFVVFLSVVVALHSAPLPWRVKKFNLLFASYLFYGAWNPPFVLLLMISTAVDWKAAQWIYRSTSTARRRLFLCLSLATNLGILGFFKYGDFALQNFISLAASIGVVYQAPEWNIILPVGISFYTFQTMAYTLDVYLKRAAPTKSLLDFSIFVSFFPQLVAGPIVRPSQLIPQFAEPKQATPPQFYWGLALVTIGLFEKVVLADSFLAPAADGAFGAAAAIYPLDAWTGVLAFSGQIFFDFSGYSTTAIGCALMLGFALPNNFRFPYAAIGFSDFWRRWHISLSTWLRDYLYIPLGGNKKGRVRTYINLMITMLLGGLWHGASWTFVVWGGLHGLYLAAERLARELMGDRSWYSNVLFKLAMALLTYFLINITWVFFRAQSFDAAMTMLASMFALAAEPKAVLRWTEIVPAAIVVSGMVATHWMMRSSSLEAVAGKAPRWLIGAIWAFMLFMLVITQGSDSAFIYFQF
ncbi:MBOAT family O-acyltransferase [Hyphococcus sp.]|uniref:MBOAT family O-acyltransferase n=1 Tax=Hyphococcus sp. TaxID=2038636 RepID=UPI0020845FC3|nr:MAG: alginate O-acetyltransferase [Marinicaulis sp.]